MLEWLWPYLPMVVVFLLGQRHFIEGIKLGAVKG